MSDVVKKIQHEVYDAEIDPDLIVPGLVISEEELLAIYDRVKPASEYSLWLLGLREHLMLRARQRGKPIVLRQVQRALHVLEPPAASEYLAQRFDRAVIGAAKQLVQMREVERDKLDRHQKQEHDKRLFQMSSQMSAIDSCRDKISLNRAYASAYDQIRAGSPALPSMYDDE